MTPVDEMDASGPAPPSHRIKVFVRADGGHIRFIADGAESDGDLVDVVHLGSEQEVDAVTRALGHILQSDALAPDAGGWHKVPGDIALRDFLKRLFHAARKAAWADPGLPGRVEFDEAYQPPTALPDDLAAIVPALPTLEASAEALLAPPTAPALLETTPARQTWDGRRIAWLGFLVGRGKSAKAIADDPIIRSTPNNVFRQVFRFGLSLSAVPHGEVCFSLPSWAVAKLDRHAEVAHLQRDAFVQRLVLNALRDGYGLAPRHYRAEV